MNKKKYLLFLLLIVLIPISIFMVSNSFSLEEEVTIITNLDELQTAISNGGNLRLDNDITVSANTFLRVDTILDLNGHTLNMSNKTLVPYANLIVKDTSQDKLGKITSSATVIQVGASTKPEAKLILESGNIIGNGSFVMTNFGTIEINGGNVKGSTYGIRNYNQLIINGGLVNSPDFTIYNQKDMVMNNGTVTSDGLGIQVYLNATFEMNNGRVETFGDGPAINFYGDCSGVINNGEIIAKSTSPSGYGIMAFKNTSVTINGGLIDANDHALAGNGSDSGNSEGTNAKFTINGGELKSIVGAGIYAPQINGETLITGGTITGLSAVEIRAGKLKITGGTFNGETSYYSVIGNDNGLTTDGAAISVAQHTTKQPIDVDICCGTYNGYTPFSITNPLNNPQEDIDKVSVSIEKDCDNLVFNSTGDTINSVGFDEYVKGGTYTRDVIDYVAPGYGTKQEDDMYSVYKYYNVILNPSVNGTGSVSHTSAMFNDEITVYPIPNDNYEVDNIIVTDDNDNTIVVNNSKFLMPKDSNAYVTINFKEKEYNVILNVSDGGTAKASKTKAKAGESINVITYPSNGYQVKLLEAYDSNNNPINVNNIIMPNSDLTINVVFEKIQYKVTLDISGGGDGTISKKVANYNDIIEVTNTPYDGYSLESIVVKDSDGNIIDFNNNEFIMPNNNVIVSINFVEDKIPVPITGSNTNIYLYIIIIAIISIIGIIIKKKAIKNV